MDLKDTNTQKNPFGIPEGYFENFETAVEARLAEEQLRELVQTPGYTMPPGYLDGIEDKVVAKLTAPDTKVISLFGSRTVYAAVAIAAALVLVVTIFNRPVASGDSISFEDIDTQTLANYINSDAIAFTDEQLMDFVSADEFTADLISPEEITDESLEDYLLENLDDIDLITTYEQ